MNPGHKRLSGRGIVTNWFSFHLGEITQVLMARTVINGKPLHVYAVHLHGGLFQGTAMTNALERLKKELPPEKVEEAKKEADRDTERRKLEIANLVTFIQKTLPSGMPAILLGDFNTTVDSGDLSPLLIEGKWFDSYRLKNPETEGVTWDPINNPNFHEEKGLSAPYDRLRTYHDRYPARIDFILLNSVIPSDHVLDSRVVMKSVNGISPSDHYGVLTTLKW
jgi:endonuclease/exonuclease/phosphatase family metal-dependent hydrolase